MLEVSEASQVSDGIDMQARIEFESKLVGDEEATDFDAFATELIEWVQEAYPFADRAKTYISALDGIDRVWAPGRVSLTIPLEDPFAGAFAAHLLRVAARQVRCDGFNPTWPQSYRMAQGTAWVVIDFCTLLAVQHQDTVSLVFPTGTPPKDQQRLAWDKLSVTERARVLRIIETPYCGCPVCSVMPPVAGDDPLEQRLSAHPQLVDVQLGGRATMLHDIALSSESTQFEQQLALLLSHGADLEARDQLDQTPLLAALARGVPVSRFDAVRRLIAEGANTAASGRLGSARELVEQRLEDNRELLTESQVAECEEILQLMPKVTK